METEEQPDQGELAWRKSSFSGGNGGSCVELAPLPGGAVAVRDTKNQGTGPILRFTRDEWIAFSRGMWAGEFDNLTQ